jgi:hypothetical protein
MRYQLRYIRAPPARTSPVAKDDDSARTRRRTNPDDRHQAVAAAEVRPAGCCHRIAGNQRGDGSRRTGAGGVAVARPRAGNIVSPWARGGRLASAISVAHPKADVPAAFKVMAANTGVLATIISWTMALADADSPDRVSVQQLMLPSTR